MTDKELMTLDMCDTSTSAAAQAVLWIVGAALFLAGVLLVGAVMHNSILHKQLVPDTQVVQMEGE